MYVSVMGKSIRIQRVKMQIKMAAHNTFYDIVLEFRKSVLKSPFVVKK